MSSDSHPVVPKPPLRFEASFEKAEADEAESTAELSKTLLTISDTTYKDTGKALRNVHAKSHALLRGEMRVLGDAPPAYAQGLFATAKTYPVVVRLSVSPGDVLDDAVSTPRGLALKVIGVEGERVPPMPGGVDDQHTQDFLMVNGPAFLAPSIKKFLGNVKLLAATTDRVPNLKKAFSAVLQSTEKLIESLGGESGTLKSLGGHPETNPLGETYFSQVPFLFGPYIAKWSMVPVAPGMAALKHAPVDLDGKPNGLRDAINHHFAEHSGEWELRVQLCTDLEKMPIEDASVVWSEDESPFVPVARITVLAQTAWSEERSIEIDEGLSFSPWHCLAAHRPLGAINRARRVAYPASVATRSPRGRCPVHEATTP